MMLPKKLGEFKPDPRFFINVHLDGLEETHDLCVERKGVFKLAIEAIKAAKAAGFKVCTNTTVYKETDMGEIERLFEYLEQFDLDGHMLSPGYGYSAVNDREIFLTRDDVHEKFQDDRPAGEAVQAEQHADLPGFPQGRARPAVHGLGQSDLQHHGLERPLLPDYRRPLRDVRGADDQDAVGELRPRKRPALRALHGALRVRALGGARNQCQTGRHAEAADVGDEVKRQREDL